MEVKLLCPGPGCGQHGALKVIYAGFPMKLCPMCGTLWGFWSWVAFLLPVATEGRFAFMAYDGSYSLALWYWLKGGPS